MQRYGDFHGFATILLTFERVCCDKWGKMRQIGQTRSRIVQSRVVHDSQKIAEVVAGTDTVSL